MQDFMRLYSGLVERCFNSCANDFTSKTLTNNEVCPFFFRLSISCLPLLCPCSLTGGEVCFRRRGSLGLSWGILHRRGVRYWIAGSGQSPYLHMLFPPIYIQSTRPLSPSPLNDHAQRPIPAHRSSSTTPCSLIPAQLTSLHRPPSLAREA
jgi:hypothetical protein